MPGAVPILALLAPGLLLAQSAPPHLAAPPPPPRLGMGMGMGMGDSMGTKRPAATAAWPAAIAGEAEHRGRELRIDGRSQQARWLWLGGDHRNPSQLWLPLEVLQNQLGVSSRVRAGGDLELDWFGTRLEVPSAELRSLDDEVAVNALALLRVGDVRIERQGALLLLNGVGANLLEVRTGNGGRRIVLDLDGPALVRSGESGLQIGVRAGADQLHALRALGLQASAAGGGIDLSSPRPARVFTLGAPARLVLDLPPTAGEVDTDAASPLDPRLTALLHRELRWERLVRAGVRINAVQIDPRTSTLQLRPLTGNRGMEGLDSLRQLAGREGALVAVNGGFFNRVRRLPLGALRVDGRWLSGPILNRGGMAWERGGLPRFGRLRLEGSVAGPDGQSLALVALNSGFVQRGVSLYTTEWGPFYRALSGEETAIRLRRGLVVERLDPAALTVGVPLPAGDELLVARGGATLPWGPGDPLTLRQRPSDALGQASFVVGGGPLLLQDGRQVLNGPAEGFSPTFLSQGAPRTVVGSDGDRLWLITLQGTVDEGPTLSETAALLLGLGLRDALNLDGGSSTGLVMGGTMPVKGRGVAGTIHHGIGLVP